MADHEARGDDFEKKAEKKLTGWGLFGSKYEDAADLFDKAGNSFKLAKNCNRDLPTPFYFFSSPICVDFDLFALRWSVNSVFRSHAFDLWRGRIGFDCIVLRGSDRV